MNLQTSRRFRIRTRLISTPTKFLSRIIDQSSFCRPQKRGDTQQVTTQQPEFACTRHQEQGLTLPIDSHLYLRWVGPPNMPTMAASTYMSTYVAAAAVAAVDSDSEPSQLGSAAEEKKQGVAAATLRDWVTTDKWNPSETSTAVFSCVGISRLSKTPQTSRAQVWPLVRL